MQAANRSAALFPDFSFSAVEIAAMFALPPIESAAPVSGGLLHRLWRVEAGAQSYALKILSRRAVQTEAQRAQLERAEIVAQRAAQAGIPALHALRGPDGRHLQAAGDEWILLFPWREGQVLPPIAASPAQCEIMGGHLGRLHALQIRFPEQEPPRPEAFEDGHFERLLEQGRAEKCVWVAAVAAKIDDLARANQRARAAQGLLTDGWVTGHLDFDQKNVLWHAEKPLILDWESAKSIHPALELLGAGLSWAGQSAGEANRAAFEAFLRGYRRENALNSAHLATACEAVLGKWVIWLELNMARSLEPAIRGTDEEKICHDALFHALGATLQLQNDVEKYRSWCAG